MKFAFYGDSHTLGGETEDHIILNKSFKVVNEEKKALLNEMGLDKAIFHYNVLVWQQVKDQFENFFDFIHRPNPMSYPYVFGELCNVEIQQHGMVATSQPYLEILIKEHHRRAIIDPASTHLVVGLCRPSRSYSITQDGNYNVKFQMPSADISSEELQMALKRYSVGDEVLLSTYLTDNKLVLDYFTALDNIVNFAEIHGYKLTFVKHFTENNIRVDLPGEEPGTYKASCTIDSNWEMYEYCVDVWERNKKYILEKDLHQFVEDDDCCGFYHPPADTHQEFAEYIAQKIYEEN